MSNVEYKIVGYIADWEDWSADSIDAGKLTHINYAFAHIKDGFVTINPDNKLRELRKLKSNNPEIKVLISVGGWGADGFSDAALTEESRERFADSVVNFIKKHGFDGADLDWEYPCSSEAGIISRPEDKMNFTLLLRTVNHKLKEAGEAEGKEYLLTIASGAMQEQIDNLELEKIAEIIDFINIMTYDFHNGLSRFSGHHANLYSSICDDGDKMSVEKAVENHIMAGVPPHKLVMGFPFYGRGWRIKETDNNGLYEFSESSCEVFPNKILLREYININGFRRCWDESAKAAYLWDGSTFISYEDAASIRYKTDYIKAKGLGGAMFWEYMQDEDEILLSKIYNDLRGR